MAPDSDSGVAGSVSDPGAAARDDGERAPGLAASPTPGAVRTPGFFDRGPDDGENATLTCRECGYSFPLPYDWCNDHSGEHVGCPNCSLSSRIPVSPDRAGIS